MLVCNVSLRPTGRVIAAALEEAGAADDASTTGTVVFATLIDDPASVSDTVNGFLGSIMIESATAAAIVNVGLTFAAAVSEPVTALDVPAGTVPTVYTVGISEVGAAIDAPDATVSAAAVRQTIVAGSQVIFVNSTGATVTGTVPGIMINE